MSNCSIIRDLIPLYEEDLLSEESKKFVENHILNCSECKKKFSNFDFNGKSEDSSFDFLKSEIRKEKNKYFKAILFLCLSFFVIFGFYITKPIHFENDHELFTIVLNKDNVVVEFNEKVKTLNVTNSVDDFYVEASTSFLDMFLNKKGNLHLSFDNNSTVYYVNQKAQSDLIFSRKSEFKEVYILPRLVLNQFIIIVFIFTFVFGLMYFIFRKKVFLKILGILFSIIFAFLSVKGLNGATHYLFRDSLYICILSFFYCLLLKSIFDIFNSRI